MFCRNCGKEINATQSFCSFCGAQSAVLTETEQKRTVVQQPQTNIILNQNKETVKKYFNHKGIGAVAVLVIVAIAVVFLVSMGGGYKGVVKDYFSAIEKMDAEKMLSIAPEYWKDWQYADETWTEEELIDEMYDFIISEWSQFGAVFSKEDLCVSEDTGKDYRINWKESRYVGVKRIGTQIFEKPQCIGICSIE